MDLFVAKKKTFPSLLLTDEVFSLSMNQGGGTSRHRFPFRYVKETGGESENVLIGFSKGRKTAQYSHPLPEKKVLLLLSFSLFL